MMNLAKLRRYTKKQGIKHANQLKKQALIQALSDRNMNNGLQHNEMLAIKAFPHLR